MNSKNTDVINAAGRIIVASGTKGISINALLNEPELKGNNFLKNFKDEEDIYEILLLNFEIELIELFVNVAKEGKKPDVEIELLFKRLYTLFKAKPWSLLLIFDSSLQERYTWFENSILRIRKSARSYLTDLIERGKEENVFKTSQNTNLLVKEILGSFRSLMNDYQLGQKMIKDLKKFQSSQD
ncbi:MAG: hypothetical protein JXR61_00250 [Prolixibacteraceae bacterium]|nr:hypothetical protein [Prolixibacteraceae bacterium]